MQTKILLISLLLVVVVCNHGSLMFENEEHIGEIDVSEHVNVKIFDIFSQEDPTIIKPLKMAKTRDCWDPSISNKLSLSGFLFPCDNVDTGPVADYKIVHVDPSALGIRGQTWGQ
jgi:hypothetical protein